MLQFSRKSYFYIIGTAFFTPYYLSGIEPSARQMIPLALDKFLEKNFEDTAYFEPFYLKDFVATTPKRKVL
jgi:tRNA threonylcarbamoyladenosine biosynthesis protein TsaB